MSDLDSFGECKHTWSSRSRIAGLCIAKIGKLFNRKISIKIGILIMHVGFVGPDDDVFYSSNGVIRKDSYMLQTDWSGKSGRSPS